MGKQMARGLPKDADGEALRRIVAEGSDLSKPMYVNFQVAVPDEESAEKLAALARKLGYQVSVYGSPECTLPWTCECSTRMIATYESVVAIQGELTAISAQFGGIPDGWGTFGNGPTGQPPVN
jgi:regulator of RNase E activity RraB